MSIAAMLRQSLSTLWQNRVRSALTVLGVVIGIAAVIALVGLSAGMRDQVADRLSGMDATRITVSSQDPERATAARGAGGPGGGRGGFAFAASEPSLTASDYQAITGVTGVAAASPEISIQTSVTLTEDAELAAQYQLLGVDVDYAAMSDYTLTAGEWLTSAEVIDADGVVVLGADAADELYGTTEAVGETVWVNDLEYVVTGVLEAVDAAGVGPGGGPNGRMYTGYLAVLELTEAESLSTIVVDAASDDVVPDVQAAIDDLLAVEHGITEGANPDYAVSSNQDLLDTITETQAGFTTTLTGIAAISLLVGGIGIMNIMLMTVTERTREVGLRRAIGAKRRHILTQFLTEAVVLTTLGGLVGLALGYVLGGRAGEVLTLTAGRGGSGAVDAVFEPSTAILAVGVAVGVGVVFGIVPAVRAARLDPAAALRYE